LIFKSSQNDTFLLIGLLIISFVSVYYLPMIVNKVVFLLILFAAYRTKLDYVYLVWFFIINNAPGRLFSAGGLDDVRIPLYNLTAGISLSFQDLFLLLYLLKYLSLKRSDFFIFRKDFIYFFYYGLFVIIYSIFMGMSGKSMIYNFRTLIPWSLIFIIPAYVNNSEILFRLSRLIFPIVLLAFFSQIFSYITGNFFDYYLRGVEFSRLVVEDGREASRSYSAVYLTFFSVIQAFYYYYIRKFNINQNYLTLILFLGFFSIFLTATRGWIIALFFFFAGSMFFLLTTRQSAQIFRLVFLSLIIFLAVSTQIPIIKNQFQKSTERLATLEDFAEGDISADGTLSRLDIRGPKVMAKFWESPVFGWGFSNEFNKSQDSHVGNQNILLNIGILGYIFVIGLFVNLCLKIYRRSKSSQAIEPRASLIYLLALASIFILHTSSTQFWGYNMGFDQLNKVIFLSFFFAAVNTSFLDYRKI
jgi:hypothetical protein